MDTRILSFGIFFLFCVFSYPINADCAQTNSGKQSQKNATAKKTLLRTNYSEKSSVIKQTLSYHELLRKTSDEERPHLLQKFSFALKGYEPKP